MTTLFDHTKQVQRFLRDANQELVDFADIVEYTNRARREIAGRTQCIRDLNMPIQGGITTITASPGGSGYLPTDTLTISTPDSPSGAAPWPAGRQATAGFAVNGAGSITAVNVIDGGDGYFQPAVSIKSATGSGAKFTAQTSVISQTVANQEIYNFADLGVNPKPGYGQLIAIRNISIIYNNLRYTCLYYPFSIYQAMVRNYPRQYYYVPTIWSQLGQGSAGSVYMYPIASQPYQMEWDGTFLPADLLTNQDAEAIPQPWADAVPYFAAHLAFAELQNLNASMAYLKLYDQMTARYSAYARPGRATNVYGRF